MMKSRKPPIHKIHTSEHADTATLKDMVNAINPKNIVPIHTFSGSKYDKICTTPIDEMNDGERREIYNFPQNTLLWISLL